MMGGDAVGRRGDGVELQAETLFSNAATTGTGLAAVQKSVCFGRKWVMVNENINKVDSTCRLLANA